MFVASAWRLKFDLLVLERVEQTRKVRLIKWFTEKWIKKAIALIESRIKGMNIELSSEDLDLLQVKKMSRKYAKSFPKYVIDLFEENGLISEADNVR